MSEDMLHPRDRFDVLGGEAAEDSFIDAMQRGRLHHAWLLVGPEGVGKATFAYRAARRLLGAAADPSRGRLGAAPEDTVCRQILGRAHPDLLVLQRDPEDGKTRKGIPVDEARVLPEFFAKSPAAAPYRVAIIDAADDMNPQAANAVLKTLEEPPERGVLFLVSHAPGGLLPTLRSRCRRLRFTPPPRDRALAWVEARAQISREAADQLLRMADGAPGQAWRLAASSAADLDAAARTLLDALPKTDDGAILKLVESFRHGAGAERFYILLERLAAHAHERAVAVAMVGGGASQGSDRWAEIWEGLMAMRRDVEAVNLDKGDAFFTALSRLRAVA